jgi:F420-non-reducing hydrogenase small subunit
MKPKVVFYWCASCGGCEEAVVDLADKILDVAAAVDIVFWPVAMDFKRKDVEAMADGSITATFLNGAIRTSEQEEMARLLRKKSQLMIAFGSCAHLGGIPGLANLWSRESIFATAYQESPSTLNPDGTVPLVEYRDNGRSVHLPAFYDTVCALDQVVDVDYYTTTYPAAHRRPSSWARRLRRCWAATCRPRAPCSHPTVRSARSARARIPAPKSSCSKTSSDHTSC